MCVDPFIHIVFPFSYKWITTTKEIVNLIVTIMALWMLTMLTIQLAAYAMHMQDHQVKQLPHGMS